MEEIIYQILHIAPIIIAVGAGVYLLGWYLNKPNTKDGVRSDMETTKLITEIPKDLHKKLKTEAIKRDMTLKELVVEKLIRS